MTTVPARLPWATQQDWGRIGPRRNTAYAPKVLLHSTETGGFPGYNNGADQPNLTIDWASQVDRVEVRQHQSLLYGARALLDSPAAPVNSMNVWQVEMVGTCDAKFAARYGYPYLPDLADEYLAGLGAFLVKFCAAVGVSPETSVRWVPYPESYGVGASQRLSLAQYGSVTGVIGHMHAPVNDHGDPGSVNVLRALSLAGTRSVIVGRSDGVLTNGDSGDKVAALQALLNADGAKPLLDVDGVFGPATDRAVRARQAVLGVTVDGAWGPASAAAEAVASGKPTPPPVAPTPPVVVKPPAKPTPPRFPLPSGHAYAVDDGTIYTHSGVRGSDGAQVKAIQRKLGGLTVDGIFGARTAAAVRAFQRKHRITVDGEVGPATWSVLFG